jgi:F-type H+-transporting ATPase subunit b
MLIDWFTVVAQALNFLILIWLMKKFLYKPILEAVDAREKEIADKTAQAALLQTEASKSLEEFQLKNNELQANKARLMSTATSEAGAMREQLLKEAQEQAVQLKLTLQKSFDQERVDLSHAIGEQLQQQVFVVAKKMLGDIASSSLEEQIIHAFSERINRMEAKEKELLSAALLSGNQPVVLRSAFVLSPEQKEILEAAIQSVAQAKPVIQYETVTELIGGIEFVTGNYKLSWSIGNYLSSLEKKIAAVPAEVLQ